MKKFILSIFVFIIGFIGFSSAQFVSEVPLTDCVSSSCSFSDFDYFMGTRNITEDLQLIDVHYYRDVGGDLVEKVCNVVALNYTSFGEHPSIFTLDYVVDRLKWSCGYSSGLISFKAGTNADRFNVFYSSDKMPVSALSPAINGLYSVVLECLPLIVYVCIGILVSILGFYAIKWLIDYILGKIKDLF